MFKNIPRKIFKRKLSVRDQVRFARRLSAFIGTGIPLPEALAFMDRSQKKGRRKSHVDYTEIVEKVSKGEILSSALSATGKFDGALIAMVCIGEQSGALDNALLHAGDMLEGRDELSRKIIGAMIYPILIGLATLVIAGFLVIYIFPKIIPLVLSMNIPLPFLTRVLMVLSAFFIHDWIWIILGSGAFGIVAVFLCRKFKIIGEKIRRGLFLLPIIGSILYGRIIVDIFDPLGLLLEHGETLPSAIFFIQNHVKHSEFQAVLEGALERITQGAILSESLRENSRQKYLFSSIVIDLLEMGERTGGIASACTSIAHIYKAEAEESISHLSHVIEPVLMLGMGCIVGSIALSIVLPIYEITNHLSH